jgi:hypothetical protein
MESSGGQETFADLEPASFELGKALEGARVDRHG